MKYRIIQRGDGKYKVQEKENFISPWHNVTCYFSDYASYSEENLSLRQNQRDCDDHIESVFSVLHDAERKVESLMQQFKLEESRKAFNVIKEFEV